MTQCLCIHRRGCYEVFLVSHWIGYSLGSLFLLLHLAESTLPVVLIVLTFLVHAVDFLKKAWCMYCPVPKAEAQIQGEVCVLSLYPAHSLGDHQNQNRNSNPNFEPDSVGHTAGDYAWLNVREVSMPPQLEES